MTDDANPDYLQALSDGAPDPHEVVESTDPAQAARDRAQIRMVRGWIDSDDNATEVTNDDVSNKEILEALRMTDYTYTARFSPQVWIRDNAVEVDLQGPIRWDCTQAVRENLDYFNRLAEAEGGWNNDPLSDEILDNDDVLRHDPAAPEWVREWSGPFSIWVTRTEADAAAVIAPLRALADRERVIPDHPEALPDPATMTPEEAGTWVGRMMWAFRADDPRSQFARRLGLRIAEFRL